MTHELKKIFYEYEKAHKQRIASVLATVVHLEGSSYRRPGVKMLLLEDGSMVGAVSGGCVEKEIYRQALSVFKTSTTKMMTYDGRYRLGCEGVLYILIEPFSPSEECIQLFKSTIKERKEFSIKSYYTKEVGDNCTLGSVFVFDEKEIPIAQKSQIDSTLEVLKQEMKPCFKLMIFGTEHDAVQLTAYATLTGWEVAIVATLQEDKKVTDFPGANEIITTLPKKIPVKNIDQQTAIVIMTHSYVKDLKYLQALKDTNPVYIGILGPIKRREKLLNEFLEYYPDVSEDFVESIHGPAGLNIGAETPQEIAISVLSEILSVVRNREPAKLSHRLGQIHV